MDGSQLVLVILLSVSIVGNLIVLIPSSTSAVRTGYILDEQAKDQEAISRNFNALKTQLKAVNSSIANSQNTILTEARSHFNLTSSKLEEVESMANLVVEQASQRITAAVTDARDNVEEVVLQELGNVMMMLGSQIHDSQQLVLMCFNEIQASTQKLLKEADSPIGSALGLLAGLLLGC